jgi:hypothetical protein
MTFKKLKTVLTMASFWTLKSPVLKGFMTVKGVGDRRLGTGSINLCSVSVSEGLKSETE